MSNRKRHTQIAVNLSEGCERFVPQKVKALVNQLFLVDGILCCPFQLKSFRELGIGATYAQIVPKSEQAVLTKAQDVVNHPGNLVPTIGIIHEQMELHRSFPGFTLTYLHEHPEEVGKDVYGVRLAKHINREHILLKFLHSGQNVIMPEASRQFWYIHNCVFDLCHGAVENGGDEPQGLQSLLNTMLFNTVTSHIAIPIIQRLVRESNKDRKPRLNVSPMLAQRPVSFENAAQELLAKRYFELKAAWWVVDKASPTRQSPEYCNIYILWCSHKKRTFDITSKDDFAFEQEYDELIRSYKGRGKGKFKNLVYVIHFDDLVKNLKPGSLSSLRSTWSATDVEKLNLNFNISGPAFSRSQQKRSPASSPTTHKLKLNPRSAQSPVLDEWTQNHAQRRQALKHAEGMFNFLGYRTGSLVLVSNSSRIHAGEVCVVKDFEGLVEGRECVFNVYLETLSGNSRFRIRSSYLQQTEQNNQDLADDAVELQSMYSVDELADDSDAEA